MVPRILLPGKDVDYGGAGPVCITRLNTGRPLLLSQKKALPNVSFKWIQPSMNFGRTRVLGPVLSIIPCLQNTLEKTLSATGNTWTLRHLVGDPMGTQSIQSVHWVFIEPAEF